MANYKNMLASANKEMQRMMPVGIRMRIPLNQENSDKSREFLKKKMKGMGEAIKKDIDKGSRVRMAQGVLNKIFNNPVTYTAPKSKPEKKSFPKNNYKIPKTPSNGIGVGP